MWDQFLEINFQKLVTMTQPRRALGQTSRNSPVTWVQTDRATHERWAQLILTAPRSAQLMHILCAHVGEFNAVAIAQPLLAKMMGCTERTVRNALAPLVEGNWIQVVQMGARGTVNAYVINDRVAWTKNRDERKNYSLFSAMIVADAADQTPETLNGPDLRRLPMIYPPEQALPTGSGDPGAQMLLDGMEPVIEGEPRFPLFEEDT